MSKRTIQLVIDRTEDLTELRKLSTIFGSATRYAFNRLLEGEKPSDLIKKVNIKFDLNKRYAEDAVLKAQSIISSQKALLPLRIEEIQRKIAKTERKLEDYRAGKKTPNKVSLETCIKGLDSRLETLRKKENNLLLHQKNETIPKVIFGGRKNFFRRMQGKITNEGWKELRSNTLYSRGDKSKKGNLNTRIVWDEEQAYFLLEVANPLNKKNNRSERLRYKLHTSDKRFSDVVNIVLPQETSFQDSNGNIKTNEAYQPYTVELKYKNGKWYVFLSYDIQTVGEELTSKDKIDADIIAGIDINIDRITVSIITKQGRLLETKTFYCHEMEYVRGNKRSNIAGEIAKEVIDYFLSWNVGGFVLEDLTFQQIHDTNKMLNRLTANFAYRKLHHALMTRGLKYGFKMKQVNPAYTSVIGRFKYSKMYGLSAHEAASYVIGRRGLGFDEKIPRELIKTLKEKVKSHLLQMIRSMEESEKLGETQTQKRNDLVVLRNNIQKFKEKPNWMLWNVIQKTLRMKNQEILLLKEV
ncbi:IS200/IS605 family accessory protein TnpB-related protein [Oceanobacillus profundus]|uniref:Transposase n=1 Tax=Oceanobacillus profundus TaxID=372463 RepID=A0A417YDS5_9BACI|nr:IS200/IS605 family accessory protein TnpB-related protein [Oceanobacillus profundus]RHW30807.1 transposase [Oceanobacillus profundus]